jgi:hypothetical protein
LLLLEALLRRWSCAVQALLKKGGKDKAYAIGLLKLKIITFTRSSLEAGSSRVSKIHQLVHSVTKSPL